MSFLTEEFDPEVEKILDQMAAEDLYALTDEEIQEHADTYRDWDE